MSYGINEIQSLSFKEENRAWCVYKHTLKETGQVYIGQTNNIKNRWKPSAYKQCVKFYNAIQKYGWDNFEHEILANNLTLEEANELETKFIIEYNSINNGFNLNTGGDNKLASPETKEKMSKTRKGIPKSEQHKQAISEALTGYKQTEEHKKHNRVLNVQKLVKNMIVQQKQKDKLVFQEKLLVDKLEEYRNQLKDYIGDL